MEHDASAQTETAEILADPELRESIRRSRAEAAAGLRFPLQPVPRRLEQPKRPLGSDAEPTS